MPTLFPSARTSVALIALICMLDAKPTLEPRPSAPNAAPGGGPDLDLDLVNDM